MKIKKSQYVIISKKIIRLLLRETCWGKGSLHLETMKRSGFKEKEKPLIESVLQGLIKQNLVIRKKHKHGWKYFLNKKQRKKLFHIAREISEKISTLLIF